MPTSSAKMTSMLGFLVVACSVGLSLEGDIDGLEVRREVGICDVAGSKEGYVVDNFEGDVDGLEVGKEVGICDGRSDGDEDTTGFDIGSELGIGEGCAVGICDVLGAKEGYVVDNFEVGCNTDGDVVGTVLAIFEGCS